MCDIYQDRYLAHQKRKKASLSSDFGTSAYPRYKPSTFKKIWEVFSNRRSQRVWNGEKMDDSELFRMLEMFDVAPTSCDRKPIIPLVIEKPDEKALLGGLLVGGVGWIHRADKVILLFADRLAYKNPAEVSYMPYLDAGVIAQTLYIAAEAQNLGGCFVNPNIRPINIDLFNERFNEKEHIFCGAFAVGKYDKKAIK